MDQKGSTMVETDDCVPAQCVIEWERDRKNGQ
jgi:hypothetical protein